MEAETMATSSSSSHNYLCKCVMKGSAVCQILYGHIRSPLSMDVIFGKETSIELLEIGEHGNLLSVWDQTVFGTIRDLALLPCARRQMCDKDLLVAISDSGRLSLLKFCDEINRFIPTKHVQLLNLGKTTNLLGGMLTTDSSGCFIAARAYEDQLALFHVDTHIINEKILLPSESEETIRGTIRSMCFISLKSSQQSKAHGPILAIITHRRGEPLNELQLLEWNITAQSIDVISQYVKDDGVLALDIVEVPNSKGLAFLFRAGDVLLMNFKNPHSPTCLRKTSLNFLSAVMKEQPYVENSGRGQKYICSWSWEPKDNKSSRMIFCAHTGEMFMFRVFHISKPKPKLVVSECLYQGQPFKELLWFKDRYVAAILQMGNSVVFKLKNDKLHLKKLIPNTAPIMDVANDERHGKMYACCGVSPEGSLKIIESGISVERVFMTGPTFSEVFGIWTVRRKVTDSFHSFIVVSQHNMTTIYSVGPEFIDLTDSIGFTRNVLTLACGLLSDDMLVQIYHSAVKLCLCTATAHSSFWSLDNLRISSGAVGPNFIVVSTFNPCFLFILGVSHDPSTNEVNIGEMHRLKQHDEISCISIPRNKKGEKQSITSISENRFVIGTHAPSVEIWSFTSDRLVLIARALTNVMEIDRSFDLVPQDVRLVCGGKYCVLVGLRNGTLIRFECPENDDPSVLKLIAVRLIGVSPVSLVPIDDTLDADIIALCDRPWLLHTTRHGLSYTSISLLPSSHVTHVAAFSTFVYPKGILFIANKGLHMVQMVHQKRFNVKKFPLEGNPRKILYHIESEKLLLMRTGLDKGTHSSDVCCVDSLSGSVLSVFELEGIGEGRSMELVKFENDRVLVVGCSLLHGPDAKPNGEAESVFGYLLVLYLDIVKTRKRPTISVHESQPNENVKLVFRKACKIGLNGIPRAICPYLDGYFLASAGNAFYICGLEYNTGMTWAPRVSVRLHAKGSTRFLIRSLAAHCSRIAVGDGRDGIIIFSYDKEVDKLEQLYVDPSLRLVLDCILIDDSTAVVSDLKGSISVLGLNDLEAYNASPERNLKLRCAYFMAEVAMCIRKGSYSYIHPADDDLLGAHKTNIDLQQNAFTVCTLLGSVMIFIPLSSDDYHLLEAVQAKLLDHQLTAPILGNVHDEFRSLEKTQVGLPKILDGDMLTQFLELTIEQQRTILQPQSVKQVVQLLEQVHIALN